MIGAAGDIDMDLDEFLKRSEQNEALPAEEQKRFYEQVLEREREKTAVRVYAGFCCGRLFYQAGDFRRTIEIIEPIVVDYHSYPYTPKMLSCFNLIGVATHCEAEYRVSRFFYETALKIAKEHSERFYYAFEYNNIALTYIAEGNYTEALNALELAKEAMEACDEEMGAYIYINRSISLQKLGRLEEAQRAFETGVERYHADEVVPDDALRCAATLAYRSGRMQEYEACKDRILSRLDEMHAAESMDACKELFECGMALEDHELVDTILGAMERYMERYPDELEVGLAFSELKYSDAAERRDKDGILDALEKKNAHKDRMIEHSMENRVRSLEHCIEINSQIADLESDPLTGFKNRKAYYKDIDMIERDREMSMRPVGVVFADANGLKETNDRFGHEAGDELIVSIAQTIAAVFPDAKCYRFGGDEFVILSFDPEKAAFDDKLERLSREWGDGPSASIGGIWKEHAKDLEKSVAAADEMMYTDKSRYYERKMHDRRSRAPVDTEGSLKRVEAVADLLPGGFFVYHADGEERLITFNQELWKIFKCQDQEEFLELTGGSFKGMVHPDDLMIVERDISSQIRQEEDIDRVRYRIVCRDGTIKTVLDYGRFVHTEAYGDVYYVFMDDISENG